MDKLKPCECGEYRVDNGGGVWECAAYKGLKCRHQTYDCNPDGSINIVMCGYTKNLLKALEKGW